MEKILLICFIIPLGNCWDLNNFGINENYYVASIAIYRTRVFLALPRSLCRNNVSNPTVVEVPWTGSLNKPTSNLFRFNILEYQKWKKCNDIQDAISLDMEPRKPKLWILDKGNEYCHPKILSFNVIFNTVSEISEFKNVPRENLNVITIDPNPSDFGSRVYIGNAGPSRQVGTKCVRCREQSGYKMKNSVETFPLESIMYTIIDSEGDNTILVYSTDNLKWWKLTLRERSHSATVINADYLAISKTDPIMYITGRNSLELFSINLDDIRTLKESTLFETRRENNVSMTVNVTLIGQKLGMSTGLETDYKSGLCYYMVRDYVVARWLIGLPMTAEYHRILAQSYEKLPYVSELFMDPHQYGLWALVNPLSPDDCRQENNMITENIPKLESRIVKISKYNMLSDNVF